MKLTMKDGVISIDTRGDWSELTRRAETALALTIIALFLSAGIAAYKYLPMRHSVNSLPTTTPPVHTSSVLTALDSTWLQIQELKMEIAKIQSSYETARLKFYRDLAMKNQHPGIHWQVLYGLWRHESTLNHESKGDGRWKKNMRGDSTMIPNSETAFGLGNVHVSSARDHYRSDVTKEELLNPIVGADASAKILADYTAMFHGNLIYGIAAYQQGPAPTKWEYDHGIMPGNLKYVARVLNYAAQAE